MDVYVQVTLWIILIAVGVILFCIDAILSGLLVLYTQFCKGSNGEHHDRDSDTNVDSGNYDTDDNVDGNNTDDNDVDVSEMDRKEPSYRLVMEIIGTDSWFEVGASLGLPEWHLKAVEQNYPLSNSRCMLEVFELWRKADGEDGVVAFTWSSLLKQLEHTSLKRRLKKMKLDLRDKLIDYN